MNKSIYRLLPIALISSLLLAGPANAILSIESTNTIKGRKPTLDDTYLQEHINDFDLFGISYTEVNLDKEETHDYYGDEAVKKLSVKSAYPFKKLFKASTKIKQPDSNQYVDEDGDGFKEIVLTGNKPLTEEWFYTDNNGKDVAFTPKESDTFCSLAANNQNGPYKFKISGNITLRSQYGDPNENNFPNETYVLQPSKTYVIMADAGICYVRPGSLDPDLAEEKTQSQWTAKRGFIAQSSTDGSKNFPTTAFYNAAFQLELAKSGLENNYTWRIIKGSELVRFKLAGLNQLGTTSNTATSVTGRPVIITFTTQQALKPELAWNLVVGSANGFEVIIEGKPNNSNNPNLSTITYPFKITKWFATYVENFKGDNSSISNEKGSGKEIEEACEQLPGNYRISHAEEVINAPLPSASGKGKRTYAIRQIGQLLGEWGLVKKSTYPGSWGGVSNLVWLKESRMEGRHYCDVHANKLSYHCDQAETANKSGVCTAIP